MTLVDSDVLIRVMRAEVRANAFLETLSSIALSAVNHIELIQGMRNRRELRALRDFMRVWDAHSFPITESISTRAVETRRTAFPKPSLAIGRCADRRHCAGA